MATAQDFIYQALRKCGQMRPGYTNNADLLNDGLTEFQALYDGWNSERTSAYAIPDYIYPIASLTGLQGIYGPNVQFLIGPSFTFTGGTTNLSKTVTVANTNGLIIGQKISGTGIPANTWITALSINVSITMNNAATANNAAVTITVTPDFVGPRPESIIRMNLYYTSGQATTPARIPLTPLSAEEWANIVVVQFTAVNVTQAFYYDPQFPCGVINVWPPLNGNSLEIFTWGFLTPPVALTTTMSVPPGYQDAIAYQLAKRLYHLCTNDVAVHKVPHEYLLGQAHQAITRVRLLNAPKPRMRCDFVGGAGKMGGSGVSDWGLLFAGVPY